MNWFLTLFDATNSKASLKHFAYACVVVSGIVWLSVDLGMKQGGNKHGISPEWVAAFGLLLGAVTTGKVMGSSQTPKDEQLPKGPTP